jgi:DNA end-binding protein Ku
MATSVMTPTTRASHPHAAPASRASWCGQLRIGDLCVPVKAYAAIATPPETPLRQLHDLCGQRIEYRKSCPKHGAVPPEEIVKGYPYQPDQYVQFSTDELEQLQPEDDKTIYLKHFLEPSLVDLVLLAGRSLSLAPANPAAQRPFATIQQAIRQSAKWGIGQVVFSGKRQIVLVRSEDSNLMLHTMHHPDLRRALGGGNVGDFKLPAKDLRPLRRIIDSADGTVPWEDFRDDTDQRLAKLVQAKIRPAKRRRANGSNGRNRSTAARSNSQTKARNSSGTPRKRRKAA